MFGYWKMACIVEGVYTRRLRGSHSGAGTHDVHSIARRVETLLDHAADVAATVL